MKKTETTGVPENFTPERIREDNKKQRAAYAARETIGERFVVPRSGKSANGNDKKGVDVIIYRPKKEVMDALGPNDHIPVLFNMHGGAWIWGDAVLMESFCQKVAEEIPAIVVNINYTKIDEQPFPYAIEEVVDTVEYFRANNDEFKVCLARMAVGGHSAGAQLAAGSALMLADKGIQLAAQMLVYPCVDMTNQGGLMDLVMNMALPEGSVAVQSGFIPAHPYISPLYAPEEQLAKVAPAIFIECGKDDLKPQGIAYAKRLIDAGIPVKVKEYKNAEHGFLEVNRPDYPEGDPRQNEEQADYCKDCEEYLIRELRTSYEQAIGYLGMKELIAKAKK